MAKAKSEDRKLIGVRVPLELWRVIRLAMVLRHQDSQQAFLLPAIQEFAERLVAEEPELKGMLRLAKENEARKGGLVAPTKGGLDPTKPDEK